LTLMIWWLSLMPWRRCRPGCCDVVAWMDQIDRLKPLFERMARQFAKFTPVSEAAKAMATKMAPAFPEGMKAKFEEMAKRAHAEREDDGER
jgi:hypothetical protein